MSPIYNEKDVLLGKRGIQDGDDFEEIDDDAAEYHHREFVPLQDRAWSFSHSRASVATNATTIPSPQISVESRIVEESVRSRTTKEQPLVSGVIQHYIFCFIYAVVNVIIAVPGLFGYAAVIFNHPIYANHMNALSKCK